MMLLSGAVILGLGWANYRFSKDDVAGGGFKIQWISIHALLTTGNSPYSDQVTAQIQKSVPIEDGFLPGNSPRYTSPLFSGLVVLPFALIGDQAVAHATWSTCQLAAIFAILAIGLRLTDWRPAWYIFLIVAAGVVFSYQVIIPWLEGSLAIWSALFLALSFLAISRDRNELAGVSLALSAIQPQMVILPMLFTLLWAGSRKKKGLILWFFITLVFLTIIGLLLVPDWILQYIRLVFNFAQNFPPGTPGVLLKSTYPGLGTQLGWLLSGILAIILLLEWWLALKKNYPWYLWTACLTMVISQWIGIPSVPASFCNLILPLVLVFALLAERSPRGGNWIVALITVLLFAGQWALLDYDLTSLQPFSQLNLLILLPLVLIIGLYWVRWWAIRPHRLLMEELKLSETY
jgi:hypothetical protein